MRTMSKVLQWTAVLLIAGFAIYMGFKPVHKPVLDRSAWTSWGGFMAVSYAGITDQGDETTYTPPPTLTRHLAAMKRAGFTTITPEDALLFLQGRHALPEKAILLIFENSRRDSFLRATPRLRKEGLQATVAVSTGLMKERNKTFLREGDLRSATLQPEWTVASMGHEAWKEIKGSDGTTKGRYLTQLLERSEKGSIKEESPADWEARIKSDYRIASSELTAITGVKPLLYVYPFADAGEGADAHPRAAEVNRSAVSMFHDLAVTGTDEAFNGPGRDPLRITRFRIPGNINETNLLAMLDQYWPRPSGVEAFSDRDWILRNPAGSAITTNGLRLAGGCVAFLRGSDSWNDSETTVTVERDREALFTLYTRYRDPGRHLRACLAPEGILLQERVAGRLFTIQKASLPAGSYPVTLTLRVRNNRAWLDVNGNTHLGPAPVSPSIARGMVSISSAGSGSLVSSFSSRPLPRNLLVTNAGSTEDTNDYSTVVIGHLDMDAPPGVPAELRKNILRLARDGTEVMLAVTNSSGTSHNNAAFAIALQEALDHSALGEIIRTIGITGWNPDLAHELRAAGFSVLHILRPEEIFPAIETISFQGDRLVVDATTSELTPIPSELLRKVPAYQIALATKEGGPRFQGIIPAVVRPIPFRGDVP